MKVYSTENSTYEVDEHNMRYRRGPRTLSQMVDSHRLVYHKWMPLKSVPVVLANGCLHIMAEDSTYGIVTSTVLHVEEF